MNSEVNAKLAAIRAALDEGKKSDEVARNLKSYVATVENIAKDLATRTGAPMEFYAVTGDLVAAIATMLGRGTGNRDLMQMLRKVTDELGELSAANRHTNNWESVPL